MNTLGRRITATFLKSPEHYSLLKKFWATKMQSKEQLSFVEHGLYLILLGKNWSKAFCKRKRYQHVNELIHIRFIYRMRASKYELTSNRGAYMLFREFMDDDAPARIEALLPDVDSLTEQLATNGEITAYKTPEGIKNAR